MKLCTRKPWYLRQDPSTTWIPLTRRFIRNCWPQAFRSFTRSWGRPTPHLGIFCLSVAPLKPGEPGPEIPDLLRRIDALLSRGADVLLFRQRALYALTS